MRAHLRAAIRAGYAPHTFSYSARGGLLSGDLGTIHRVWTPFRPLRQLMLPAHGVLLRRAVERFVIRQAWPRVLLHGFGTAAGVAASVARRLRRRGVETVILSSSYGSYEAEVRAMVRGLNPAHGRLARLRLRAEHAWGRLVLGPMERRGYRESRLVLVNYETVRRQLRDECGVATEMRRVPYAAESAFFPDRCPRCAAAGSGPPETGVPLIVALSRHDARKGVDVLLLALARLRDAGGRFRALLIGGGPFLAADRRLARRLGLESLVTIPGFVADPHVHLHEASIFVLPSLQEGSGSVALLEALQAGLPVIASACDGIVEDVDDGRSAVLVPPGDSAALAAAIQRVSADPALSARLRAGARARFEERFRPEGLVRALADTYAELGFPP